jgi:poly(hydroxyalkanoate) depolymerase family esterase
MHTSGKFARLWAAASRFFQVHRGTFHSDTFFQSAGARLYKLYVPRNYTHGRPTPLLVALHGCTQDPDSFAAGTRFNMLADQYTFLVLYPQQDSSDNAGKCWNWFISANQARGRGEPALLAGMIDHIASHYSVDPDRVFIAGMSAGAAIAVIMGACYPDYFAAIGVHSGLEYKGATDLVGAQIAMSRGGPDPALQGKLAYLSAGSAARVLPVIVFHGTRDESVAPINGDQVIQQFVSTDDYADDGIANNSVSASPSSINIGQVPNGYSYTVSTYIYQGHVLLQHYTIDGMGHAWSGGSTAPPATFTDPGGPDASSIMWNFFADHPKKAGMITPASTPGIFRRTLR